MTKEVGLKRNFQNEILVFEKAQMFDNQKGKDKKGESPRLQGSYRSTIWYVGCHSDQSYSVFNL